nr:NAD(P)-dependent alcohol dehydrogenase [Domibacillus mangrovi]
MQIYASTVASGDVVRAKMGGFLKSKNGILGQEFAGVVTEVGKKVTRFNKHDRVFGIVATGAHAEYLTVSEEAAVTKIPASVSFREAVCFCIGANPTLYFLEKLGNIRPGHQILIIGASGSVGTFAVQYAKYIGAEVTGVCSTKNIELVKELGANHVIDYNQEDFRESKKI